MTERQKYEKITIPHEPNLTQSTYNKKNNMNINKNSLLNRGQNKNLEQIYENENAIHVSNVSFRQAVQI